MKQKIAIIGAGISGVSLAQMISAQSDVTVFEQCQEIGGLINCDRVNGYLYHKVGGHVFNSKNQKVLDWFWQFFDKDAEFIKAKRLAKIYIDNRLIGYPLEDHLYEFDKATLKRIIKDLTGLKAVDKPTNFEAFLKFNFGQTLYDIYFKPYNEKMWNVDLSTVPLEWLDGKLPMPNFEDVVVNNILRQEEAEMVHSYFYYPKNNGSQFIIDRLSAGIFIAKNHTVVKIEIDDLKKIHVDGDGPYDQLVYTGDVRNLPSLLANESILSDYQDQIKLLRSNGTTNVLCSCDANDLSWLYIPEKKFKAHRIIYTGNFSPTNNGENQRTSCTVEFSNFVTEDDAMEDLKNLPGNLEFIAYNYQPKSYVIQDATTKRLIESVKQSLSSHHIHLLGRFAEWEYYNMDKAIEAAFLVADQISSSSSAQA